MDVFLFDVIGPDSLMKVIETSKTDEDINLSINSPGGSVYDGLAIYNFLTTLPNKVNVDIVGMAGSIASVVAMAGNTINIHESGMMMIHNSRAMLGGGTKDDLEKQIDLMGKIDKQMVNIYARKTGKGKKTIQALMDKETFFTSAEALSLGLVNNIIKPQKIAAQLNIDKMENLIDDIKAKFNSLMGVDLEKDSKEAADKLKAAANKLAEDKLRADIEASDTPADAITAQMVKTTEYVAKMILLDDYIKSSMELNIKAQAFIDSEPARIKAEVTEQMNALLAEVKSKTEVPAPKTAFTEFEAEQTKKQQEDAFRAKIAEREAKREVTP